MKILTGANMKNKNISLTSNNNNNNSNTATQFISEATTGTPPLVVASTTKVDNLHASQVTGDVDVSGGTFITSNAQNISIFNNAFINIDNNITNITVENYDNYNFLIDNSSEIFNLTINNLLKLLFNYTQVDINAITFNTFIDNVFTFLNGTTVNTITFNDLFFLLFNYTQINIAAINYTNFSSYLINFYNGSEINNITFNNLFLLLFKYEQINYDSYDITNFNLTVNNSTTIYNITIQEIIKFIETKMNPEASLEAGNNIRVTLDGSDNIIINTVDTPTFTNITITSDKRFKHKIKPINNCLKKVEELKPKEFEYKSIKNKKYYGFIAQDIINTEVSNIVDTSNEKKYSVDYNSVISLLTGSIKELSNELKELRNDFKELRKENKELKTILKNNKLI